MPDLAGSAPEDSPAPAAALQLAGTGLVSWLAAREALLVWAFSALLFAVNLSTVFLYPTSWIDEAMFADPAINFVHGKGFVSTAWWLSRHETWSGNVPLYSSVLVLWMKIFGVGLARVRAFNYFVISLVIPLFWHGVRRLGCLASAPLRIGLVVTAFLSFPLFFLYRSARPDCLGLLLCAWALWAWSEKNRKVRNLCLLLAGLLMPVSGLQLMGYFGLVGAIVFILEGKAALGRLTVLGAGILAGASALSLFYYCNHLTGIIVTIRETRRMHEVAVTGRAEWTIYTNILLKLKRTLGDHLTDYGSAPTLAAWLILASTRAAWSDKEVRFLALVAIGSSLALVGTLEATLHYLVYYHWMNYIILLLALFVALAKSSNAISVVGKAAVMALMMAAAAGGLPMRLLVGRVLDQGGQYAAFQSLLEGRVRPADIVFTDYMGYFPVKARATETYLPAYLKVMTEEERRGVNLLVLNPINFEGYSREFVREGRWKEVGSLVFRPRGMSQWALRLMPNYLKQPTNRSYSITILRREPQDVVQRVP